MDDDGHWRWIRVRQRNDARSCTSAPVFTSVRRMRNLIVPKSKLGHLSGRIASWEKLVGMSVSEPEWRSVVNPAQVDGEEKNEAVEWADTMRGCLK